MNDIEKAISDWENGMYENCFPTIELFANRDHAQAQYILAKAYSTDKWGKKCDLEKSVLWYRLAANNHHPHAALQLGMLFDPNTEMRAMHKDQELSSNYYNLACDLYSKGARAGDGESMYGLSLCYAGGFGIEYSEERGLKWLKKSCEAGFELACRELDNIK